jgi:outer membrane protein assembly factor BamB
MTSRNLMFGLFMAVVICRSVESADWPQWRGPQRDGTSQETGLLDRWPDEGPKLLWQLNDLGDGYSTPSVAGVRLYVLTNEGIEDEFVRAYSVADHSEVWTTRIGQVGNPNQQPPYAASRSTPTVDGDRLYVLSSDGDIACLNTSDGKILWTKNVRTEFGGKPGTWAYAESPLVDGDVLICAPGGADATLLALDKRSGNVVWKCPVPEADDAGYASPIIVDAAGRKQYVQFLSKGVVGVDAETGDFLWRYDGTGSGPANAPTPVAHANLVYSAAGRVGGGLVALKTSGDGVSAEEVYMKRGLPNGMGGAVLVDGYLYGTSQPGLICAEFDSGEVKWQDESIGQASVCVADGRLFLHGFNNDVALVEVTPEGYHELGRFSLPDPPEHNRGRMEGAWAYPIVADGRLFIRDKGTIWCYDVSGP